MNKLKISFEHEKFPLKDDFTISRGTRDVIEVIKVKITDGVFKGYGECSPNKRYSQSISSEINKLKLIKKFMNNNSIDYNNFKLVDLCGPGPASAAANSALLDYKLKKMNKTIWEYLNINEPKFIKTMVTIDISSLEKMLKKAERYKKYKMFKIKLSGKNEDFNKLNKIREIYPKKKIIVDANESILPENLKNYLTICERLGIEMIEQPMKPEFDQLLTNIKSKIIFCADESCRDMSDISKVKGYYNAINIKLDKAGGLIEALNMCVSAKKYGLLVMTGCMMCTSLGIAPAQVLASYSDYVDLDAPLFLEKDRPNSMNFDSGKISVAKKMLWG
jgi:L-alanine-DL-glutamate epimerase-like enolase superfamily enzyme